MEAIVMSRDAVSEGFTAPSGSADCDIRQAGLAILHYAGPSLVETPGGPPLLLSPWTVPPISSNLLNWSRLPHTEAPRRLIQ